MRQKAEREHVAWEGANSTCVAAAPRLRGRRLSSHVQDGAHALCFIFTLALQTKFHAQVAHVREGSE